MQLRFVETRGAVLQYSSLVIVKVERRVLVVVVVCSVAFGFRILACRCYVLCCLNREHNYF